MIFIRRAFLLMSLIGLLAADACQQPTRPFGQWNWTWLGIKPPASQPAPDQAKSTTPQPARPGTPAANDYFLVRVIESTGDERALQTAWSYLDESSPVGKDWPMLQANGLRCGIGQFSDWPSLRDEFNKSGTKVRSESQVALSSFSPIVVLSDPFRSERTVFYTDREGKAHGQDFVNSSLQLMLITAGHMPEGRVRLIFSPQIARRIPNPEPSAIGSKSRKTQVERELENFSFLVDLGPREFALIGPASREKTRYLVGPQLFLQWEKGQRKCLYLLVSPAGLEEKR